MVSIRRRKLLRFCAGGNCYLDPLRRVLEHGNSHGKFVENVKPVDVNNLSITEDDMPDEEITSENGTVSLKASASSPLELQSSHQFPEVKRRKRHRRKHVENQEPCSMRGVYLKNAKWQAAIKVDKKQIHLGTVSSQEEAARLYDRAAFMCGREPNFELSEEEKRELSKFQWEEFLALTRSAITHKKIRRSSSSSQRKHQNHAWGDEQGHGKFSTSEDDTLVS